MKNNIQLEVTVELPTLPNFIKTSIAGPDGGTERHIPVEAMTDGDLKKIGEDWTRALILHAQARRKQSIPPLRPAPPSARPSTHLSLPRALAAVSRKWRDQANTLCRRANELSGHRRDKDAADMRARASVYFICADDLDKQQAVNGGANPTGGVK